MTAYQATAGHCDPRGLLLSLARHHHHGRGRHGGRGNFWFGGPMGFGGPGGPGGPGPFGRGGGRARRGDVRTALLTLLAEEPRNGYQLMQEIERAARASGAPARAPSTRRCSSSRTRGWSAPRRPTAASSSTSPTRAARPLRRARARAPRGTPPATPSTPTSGSCSASPARSAWRSSRSPRPAPPTSSLPPARSSPTPAEPSTESSPRTTTELPRRREPKRGQSPVGTPHRGQSPFMFRKGSDPLRVFVSGLQGVRVRPGPRGGRSPGSCGWRPRGRRGARRPARDRS